MPFILGGRPPGIFVGRAVPGAGGKDSPGALTSPAGIPKMVDRALRISLENTSLVPAWQTNVTRPLGKGSPLNLTWPDTSPLPPPQPATTRAKDPRNAVQE